MEDFIRLIVEELPAKKKRGRPKKGGAVMEGDGFIGDKLRAVKKTAQRVARKVGAVVLGKKTAEKVERYGDAVLFLSNLPLPPSVKEYLRKHGDELISKAVIVRNPVQKLLTGAMNVVSLGSFGKKFGRLPYDDLFHLSLQVTTPSGVYAIEKNEVITMTMNPKAQQNAEFRELSVPSDLTMNKLMVGAEKIQGSRFTRYDASSNNCQDFVMALLKGSGMGNESDYQFVKQNTDSLFKDDSFLRRMARNLTNIGASVSTALTGVDDKPISSTKTSDTFEIPTPYDTDVLDAGGRQKKLPKKAEKGQRTIPEITASQEAEAIRLADQLRNPSVMTRVHELLARQARGELDYNFRVRLPPPEPSTPPTEPTTPYGSESGGMYGGVDPRVELEISRFVDAIRRGDPEAVRGWEKMIPVPEVRAKLMRLPNELLIQVLQYYDPRFKQRGFDFITGSPTQVRKRKDDPDDDDMGVPSRKRTKPPSRILSFGVPSMGLFPPVNPTDTAVTDTLAETMGSGMVKRGRGRPRKI